LQQQRQQAQRRDHHHRVIQGSMTLNSTVGQDSTDLSDPSATASVDGHTCADTDGYDDIESGLQVSVTNESGTVIGAGAFGDGNITGSACVFQFTINNVPPANPVTSQSAWWRLFHQHDDSLIHVGCHLDDGSFVSGWLLSYAADYEESGDRELTLSAPVFFRPAGAPDGVNLDGVGAVAVSARRIVSLLVSYVDDQQATSRPTGGPD